MTTSSTSDSHLPAVITREATLRRLNTAYHNGTPLVTDAHYDMLWRAHQADREELADLWDWPTILDEVGASPAVTSGFQKVAHTLPMLSLDNAFEQLGDECPDLEKWVADVRAVCGASTLICIEPKLDGVSLSLTYIDRELHSAVTRGDGTVGDDVTTNVIAAGLAPFKLPEDAPASLVVRGEVVMSYSTFTRLNAELEAEDSKLLANPRNAAAGALRLHDPQECAKRGLEFVAYGASGSRNLDHRDEMLALTRYGFSTAQHNAYSSHADEALVVDAKRIKQGFENCAYPIDGAVLKVSEYVKRWLMGDTARAPRWAVALKFVQPVVTTRVTGISVQVGRSGVLTPVAELLPVTVDGSVVSRATLHNQGHINRLELAIGDEVEIRKAGAIIPEIVRSVTRDIRHREVCRELSGYEPQINQRWLELRPPFDLLKHIGGKCPSCGGTEFSRESASISGRYTPRTLPISNVPKNWQGAAKSIQGMTEEEARARRPDFYVESDYHDVHTATAAKLFGIPPKEVTAEQRRAAKQQNFVNFYGVKPDYCWRPEEDGPLAKLTLAEAEARGEAYSFEAGGDLKTADFLSLYSPEARAKSKEEPVAIRCVNPSCPAQLAARIQHFCSRKALDIEGIGEEMSNALAKAFGSMNLTHPVDLLDWTVSDLMVMTWTTEAGGNMTFGESRAVKAVDAMKRARALPLHRWLFAMGIPSVGENTSKEISRLFKYVGEIQIACKPEGKLYRIASGEDKNTGDLAQYQISGRLGPISAKALMDFVASEEGGHALTQMFRAGVVSDNADPIPSTEGKSLAGQTFVLTGTLSEPRTVLEALVASKGGKCSGSVSAKTTYLVVGEGGGGKADKAKKLGVKILTEAELRALL